MTMPKVTTKSLLQALERAGEQNVKLQTAMRNALCYLNTESDAARILLDALPASSLASTSPQPGTK